MIILYGFLIYFILSFPFVRWYLLKTGKMFTFRSISNKIVLLVLLYFCMTFLLYLIVPTYREHIEPSIATLTLMFLDGLPIYTDFDNAGHYNLVYGPSTYLIQSVFLSIFSNPIFASKLYGISCVIISMFSLYYLIQRRYSYHIANLSLFYFLAALLLFSQVSFRNQAESIILLGNSLATASVLLPSTWLSMLLLSLGSALSISAKFHSAGYILPLLVFMYRQHGLKRLFIIASLTLFFLSFPFMLEQFSFRHFVEIIATYAKHQFSLKLFMENITLGLIIFVPVLYIILFSDKNRLTYFDSDTKLTVIISLLMLLAVSLVASKEGAGQYHLLPFAPSIAVLFALFYQHQEGLVSVEQDGAASKPYKNIVLTTIVIAWLLTMTGYSVSSQKRFLFFVSDNISSDIDTDVIEIRNYISSKNWSATMGYTGEIGYNYTYYRPLLWPILKNNLLDPVALMDMQHANVNISATTRQKFIDQYYDVVIVPGHDKAFNILNFYNPNPLLFGNEFPIIFLKNYYPAMEFKYFTLWLARRIQQSNKPLSR